MASDAAVYAFEPLPLSLAGYFATVAQAKRCLQELCAQYHKDICEDAHLRCSRHFKKLGFQQHFPYFRSTTKNWFPHGQENYRLKNSYVRLVGLRGGKIGEGAWGDDVDFNVALTTGNGSEMLPIRMNSQSAYNDDDNVLAEIEVYVGYQWVCFSQWLQSTFMPRFNYYSTELTQQQTQAWSRNGKTFRLLDLPREIRDMIYLYAMGKTGSFKLFMMDTVSKDLTHCLPTSKKIGWLGGSTAATDRNTDVKDSLSVLIAPSNSGRLLQERDQICEGDNRLALVFRNKEMCGNRSSYPHLVPLLVNKQVHEEVICAQWKLTTKRVDVFNWQHPWKTKGCLDLIKTYQAHYSLGALGRVQLYLDHYTYARIFPSKGLAYDKAADMIVDFLAALPPIQILEFHFAGWDDEVHEERHSFLMCYKVSIDWYLRTLLGQIRHLIQRGRFNRIVVSGHVKHSTRAMWETIFADEKQGVVHDMAEEMQLIRKAVMGEAAHMVDSLYETT
ncbi:uncharacterized protein N0V89_000219 [Didymosphaeria variabile]|uniref:Uncharacterized protein n=1 Tax=Didymosphaeria variabile TaxID=1932322 RepID=A0A9W8XUQ7_9PLEO|nr:uncharacterized protein N0V89_000219 [Didymosphaeria variabile]KAJ4359663.1 hypothetical protein N0V89_000219 [Didymosphaeria variabile]